jgi:hypothetical protein
MWQFWAHEYIKAHEESKRGQTTHIPSLLTTIKLINSARHPPNQFTTWFILAAKQKDSKPQHLTGFASGPPPCY